MHLICKKNKRLITHNYLSNVWFKKMIEEQYKIKNNGLDKYSKTWNSLNLSTTFCPMSNKNKNTILFLFSDFSLSHTFFSFFICVSFSKPFSSLSCRSSPNSSPSLPSPCPSPPPSASSSPWCDRSHWTSSSSTKTHYRWH